MAASIKCYGSAERRRILAFDRGGPVWPPRSNAPAKIFRKIDKSKKNLNPSAIKTLVIGNADISRLTSARRNPQQLLIRIILTNLETYIGARDKIFPFSEIGLQITIFHCFQSYQQITPKIKKYFKSYLVFLKIQGFPPYFRLFFEYFLFFCEFRILIFF